MKSQYVGDINDYFKYAILRAIVARIGLPLYVCWMLTENDGSTDGGLRSYLGQPDTYRAIDPALFDRLRETLASGTRDISVIEAAGLISGASYFTRLLEDDLESRRSYFVDLWQRLPARALVFFDPDNGLEVSSVLQGKRGSRRYLYLDELRKTLELDHVAIVYQHFPRVPRRAYVRAVLQRLSTELPGAEGCAIFSSRVAYIAVGRPTKLAGVCRAMRGVERRWEKGLQVMEAEAFR